MLTWDKMIKEQACVYTDSNINNWKTNVAYDSW